MHSNNCNNYNHEPKATLHANTRKTLLCRMPLQPPFPPRHPLLTWFLASTNHAHDVVGGGAGVVGVDFEVERPPRLCHPGAQAVRDVEASAPRRGGFRAAHVSSRRVGAVRSIIMGMVFYCDYYHHYGYCCTLP